MERMTETNTSVARQVIADAIERQNSVWWRRRDCPAVVLAAHAVNELQQAGFEIVRKTAAIDCPSAFEHVRLALAHSRDLGVEGLPYNHNADAKHLLGELAKAGIGIFPIDCYTPPAAVGALGFEGADFLNLQAGYFAQDGKVERYPADLVQDWLVAMAAHPVDPATRPTGDAIDVVVLMPDGTAIPMTNEEFKERAEYRDGSTLIPGTTYELPHGTRIPPATSAEAFDPMAMPFKLEPGKPYCPMPIRPTPILAVFYEDGIIQFAGDANEFAAFRDMAAKVVDPSRREA